MIKNRKRFCFSLILFILACFTPLLSAAEDKLVAHFFYTPGCPLCEPTKQAVEAVEKKYGPLIDIQRHDLASGEKTYEVFMMALEHYKREDTPNLVVFVGDVCLGGGDTIKEKLDSTVEKLITQEKHTPDFAQFGNFSKETVNHTAAKRTTLWAVLSMGFFDGFNPCAFATVILFVSMLSSVGRGKRTILAVGISFIVAVFIAYFVIGVAFFEVMKIFDASESFAFIGLAIKWLSLLIVVVAGLLSLIDAYRALRSNGKEKMLLVLPEKFKDRIRKRLRATAHSGSLIVGSFISGIIISFLEAACTGQTYLPIITLIVSDKSSVTKGYMLLILYNIMFIIPLLAVFVAVFLGMTSEQIGSTMRKKVWLTKLGLAAVFLVIAGWLGSILLPTLPFLNGKVSPETPDKPAQEIDANTDR